MTPSAYVAALDGYDFTALTVLDDEDAQHPIPTGQSASCSCGWKSEREYSFSYGTDEDLSDVAEEATRWERAREHCAAAALVAVPRCWPTTCVSLRPGWTRWSRSARWPCWWRSAQRKSLHHLGPEAAQRASFLHHSWIEIECALGISKQAAWGRYGKPVPRTST